MLNAYEHDHSEIIFFIAISVFISRPTVIHKLFEKSFGFHVNWRNTGMF